MEVDYELELQQEQLYNSMKIADTISFPHGLMTQMSRDCSIANRTFAIEWMKKVSLDVVMKCLVEVDNHRLPSFSV